MSNAPTPPAGRAVIIAGIIATLCIALAAVLLIAPGPEANARLAALFGVIAIVAPAMVAALKADQAQNQTNGGLGDRIQAGVFRAMASRRRTDIVPPNARLDPRVPSHIEADPLRPDELEE